MADLRQWGKGGLSAPGGGLEGWSKGGVGAKADKLHRNRKRIAEELLATERSYVRALDIVCKHFRAPMLLALKAGRAVLSHKDMQLMFSDIATIRDLNAKFLADLEPKIKVCFYSARAAFLRSHVSDASPHYCLSSASRPIA